MSLLPCSTRALTRYYARCAAQNRDGQPCADGPAILFAQKDDGKLPLDSVRELACHWLHRASAAAVSRDCHGRAAVISLLFTCQTGSKCVAMAWYHRGGPAGEHLGDLAAGDALTPLFNVDFAFLDGESGVTGQL